MQHEAPLGPGDRLGTRGVSLRRGLGPDRKAKERMNG